MSAYPDRGRRLEHQERAYQVQLRGGIEGFIKYTIFATLACTFAHLTWPAFRRRTSWGVRAFLVSSAGVFGMTIGADNHLLRYESHQRIEENDLRRQARNELAREGMIATETEIRKWKAKRLEKIAEEEKLKESANGSAGSSSSSSATTS